MVSAVYFFVFFFSIELQRYKKKKPFARKFRNFFVKVFFYIEKGLLHSRPILY